MKYFFHNFVNELNVFVHYLNSQFLDREMVSAFPIFFLNLFEGFFHWRLFIIKIGY